MGTKISDIPHANDSARTRRLREYEVMETAPEPRFDALTTLAAKLLTAPYAFLSFASGGRASWKSRYGVFPPDAAHERSLSERLVHDDASITIIDATHDPRFKDTPLVPGMPEIKFCVGAPLRTKDGITVGTLAVLCREPRTISEKAEETLKLLASQAIEILELQREHLAKRRELRAFVEEIAVPIGWVSKDGTLLGANQAELDLLGCTRDEYVGRNVATFHERPDCAAALIRRLVAGEEVVTESTKLRTRDGSVKFVTITATAHREKGEFAFARFITRDITKLTAAAESLAAQSKAARDAQTATLDAVLRTVADAVVVFDEDACIRSFNPSAERMFGHSADEVRGASVRTLAPEPERAEQDGYIRRVIETGANEPHSLTRETHGVRKDGSVFLAEFTVSETLVGGARMFVGMISDITLRRQIERELTEFKTTLHRLQDSVVIFEPETLRIVYANDGARMQLGYPPSEIVGRQWLDLYCQFTPHDYHTLISSLVKGEQTAVHFETVSRHKDGRDVPVEVTLQYLAPEGETPRFICTGRDISEQKRIETMKSDFVSMVSHELRTPLTSIRGSLGLVAKGVTGALPAPAAEYVGIALSNCERLVRLINDILDIEKVQSGKMELQLAPLDLAEVVRGAILANERLAESHSVAFSLVGDPRRIEVQADEERLVQVVTHLLSNAVKFSPAGQWVEVSVAASGTRARVNVRDHGPGIPESFKSRIFERFAQSDSSDTRTQGGSGLGLCISKALVELMGGTIGFDSKEGTGTNFFFDLPCTETTRSTSQGDEEDSLVLVCEDDPLVARTITRMLESSGNHVHVAPTVTRARELLGTYEYRVVTLDLTLEDGQAVPLVSEIRRGEATADLPILVISGAGRGDVEERLGAAAPLVAAILTKPLSRAALLDAIEKASTAAAAQHPRILHVEDDESVRQVVRKLLPEDWDVAAARTLTEATSLLAAIRFDLVLLDLELEDGSGEALLGSVGQTPVVIFSSTEPSRALSQRVRRTFVKSRATEVQLRDALLALVSGKRQRRGGPRSTPRS